MDLLETSIAALKDPNGYAGGLYFYLGAAAMDILESSLFL
jgi:hypothetical protein